MSQPPLHPCHLSLVPPRAPSRARRRFDRVMRKLYRITLLAAQWTEQRASVRKVAAWELQPLKREYHRHLRQLALRFDAACADAALDDLHRIKLGWLICAFAEQILMLEDDADMVDLLDKHDVARCEEDIAWDDEDVFAASGITHIPAPTAPAKPPPEIDHAQTLWMLREIWHDQAGLDVLDDKELDTYCSLARRELQAVSAVLFSQLLPLAEEWELPLDDITPAGAMHYLRQDGLEVKAAIGAAIRQLEEFSDIGKLKARLDAYALPDDPNEAEGDWFFAMEQKPDWNRLYWECLGETTPAP
ncbi:hypothetical protein GCM10027277_32730 [Pseudoduganella ginsengisoli]|uniref:DUF4272 domain-containing protein n=1 Tax=Pseudoduganella ginsengisoli TaxID=1462440 RepID=A0A6L6Q6Y9_9BURK|nr:hypothetical protein [Pseudoduganella ginsengisoli]MTW05613.1 hypothetical protein [Pseudoduganella ginsengisoli]